MATDLATTLDTVCVSVALSARVADTLKRQAANAIEVGESLTPQDAADVKRWRDRACTLQCCLLCA